MIIANPIYDVVFKHLMEDKRVARFFIETLLEETIEDVEVKPQEFTYTDKDRREALALFRLDFIATIKTATGGYKKALIEIQKARNYVDLMRFRNYLGAQYKKEDEVLLENGKQIVALPIVTIYLLGFKLPEIITPAVKVNGEYIDLITHKVIMGKSDFIEKLTHDCFVVQIPRITAKFHSRLEKLLSIFEQNYFVDEKGTIKEYNYEIDDENIKGIADILHYAGTDPERKKEIETEQEAYRVFNIMTKELNEKLAESAKIIEEKDKTIEDMAKELTELKQRLNNKK